MKIGLGQLAAEANSNEWALAQTFELNHWCTIDHVDVGCVEVHHVYMHFYLHLTFSMFGKWSHPIHIQFRFFLHPLSWPVLKPYETDSNPFINHLLFRPNPLTTIWTVLYQTIKPEIFVKRKGEKVVDCSSFFIQISIQMISNYKIRNVINCL